MFFRLVIASFGIVCLAANSTNAAEPLKALLISGGCCHDYPTQDRIIPLGVSQRANVAWTVANWGGGREGIVELYREGDWAEGYDVVVHNECFGAVDDKEYIQRIVDGHLKANVPAVFVHCALHSYRVAEPENWRELIGVTSRRHERGGRRLDVTNVAADHPIMQGFPDVWKTPNGELYVIEKVWPNCTPLAQAFGEDTQQNQVCIWANEMEGVRVFGTSLGHHNETMLSDEYLDVFARGVLWACGKLRDDGTTDAGYEGRGKGPIDLTPEDAATGEPTPAGR